MTASPLRNLAQRLATFAVALLVLLGGGSRQAHAQDTHVWNDPNGGVWGTFTKWNPIGVPSSLDVARFDLNADYTVSFVNGGQARLLQVLDGDVIFEGSGIFAGDRTLAVEDALINSNADLIIRPNSNGKSLTLSTSDDMSVRGSLAVNSGAQLSNISAVVDSAASNSRAQVSVNGVKPSGERSTWAATSLDVGTTHFGTVRISGGGHAQINGPVVIGDQSGSDGDLEVTGESSGGTASDFRSTSTIKIGRAGTGHLRLEDGGFAATSGAILGEEVGGRGNVTIESGITGNTSFWIAGNMTVRRGDIAVNRGGVLRTFGATIGTNATSSVTVSGAGSGGTFGLWEAQGVTAISTLSDANLNIEQGGLVNVADVHVGREAGGVGRINVSSSNPAQASRLLQSGDLYLGGDEFGSGGVGHLNLITNAFARIDGALVIYDGSSVVMGPGSTLIAQTIDNTEGGFFDFLRGTLHTKNYSGNLTNQEGTLAPYRSGSLTGDGAGDMNIFGNYTQQPGATLAIDVGGITCGVTYDHVNVTGVASLSGTLELSLNPEFLPQPDDTMTILMAGNLTGNTFANAVNGQRLDTIDGLGSFIVNYGFGSAFDQNSVVLSDFLSLAVDLAGDYNSSGQVEQGDLDLVLQNWGVDTDVAGIPAGWTNDLPSGQIEQTELDGILQNWGDSVAPNFSGSAVPEPASLALLGLGVLALMPRRRFSH